MRLSPSLLAGVVAAVVSLPAVATAQHFVDFGRLTGFSEGPAPGASLAGTPEPQAVHWPWYFGAPTPDAAVVDDDPITWRWTDGCAVARSETGGTVLDVRRCRASGDDGSSRTMEAVFERPSDDGAMESVALFRQDERWRDGCQETLETAGVRQTSVTTAECDGGLLRSAHRTDTAGIGSRSGPRITEAGMRREWVSDAPTIAFVDTLPNIAGDRTCTYTIAADGQGEVLCASNAGEPLGEWSIERTAERWRITGRYRPAVEIERWFDVAYSFELDANGRVARAEAHVDGELVNHARFFYDD